MKRRTRLVILLAAGIFSLGWVSPFSREIDSGNSDFRGKDFTGALGHYRNAEKYAGKDAERAVVDFNIGDAEYALGNYDRAVEQYKKSAASGDREIAKKSFLNMGNAYLKNGKRKEAADSYVKALELDPEYEKARKNLEYLMKKNSDNKNDKNSSEKENSSEKQNQEQQAGKEGKPGKSTPGGKQEISPEQMNKVFESMKNRPVRRQKGDGNGKKVLEKYW